MLVLSVMTLIGGMSFAATAKKRPAARKVASESYTCGSERITVSYPATNAARVVTKAGMFIILKQQYQVVDQDTFLKMEMQNSSKVEKMPFIEDLMVLKNLAQEDNKIYS